MAKHHLVIAGANGFIASHLINSIDNADYDISRLTKSSLEDIPFLSDSRSSSTKASISFTSNTKLFQTLKKADTIILLHGNKFKDFSKDKKTFYDQYFYFTAELINIIYAINPCCKIIYLSSGGLCKYVNSPVTQSTIPLATDAYSASRLKIEQLLVNKFNTKSYVILRVFSVFGSTIFSRNKARGLIDTLLYNDKNNIITNLYVSPDLFRNFVHIDDVVSAIKKSIDYKDNSQIFNIGFPESSKISDILCLFNPDYISINNSHFVDIPSIPCLDLSSEFSHLNWKPHLAPITYILNQTKK